MYDNNNSSSNEGRFTKANYGRQNQEGYYEIDRTRPTSITVVCVLIGISLLANLLILVEYLTRKNQQGVSSLSLIFTAVSLVFVVAALVGLWGMKKWGAWLYTINFLLSVGSLIFIGGVNIIYLIVPVIIQFFIYSKYSLMD